jgi:mycoredoxin
MTNASLSGSEITVYSTAWCGDCRMAKAVLDRHGASYRWIDIDRHPDAVEVVLRLNGGYRTVPTIVFPDGRVLVEPSRRELEQALAEPASAA